MRRDVLEKIVKEYKRDKNFYFKLSEELKEKQIQNALKKICCDSNIGRSKLVALMDTTVLESGKSGYLLTEQYLYGKFDQQKIPLDGMTGYQMVKNDCMKLYYQDNRETSFYISIFQGFEDFIQRIIQAQYPENMQNPKSAQKAVKEHASENVQRAEKEQVSENAQKMEQNQRLVNVLKSISVVKEREALECKAKNEVPEKKPEPFMPKVPEKKPEPVEQRTPENETKMVEGFLYGSKESREKLRAENEEKIEDLCFEAIKLANLCEFEAAVSQYRKAAELGDDDALAELGLYYYYGIGVQRDAEKAKELLRQINQRGVVSAAENLEKIKQLEEMDEQKLYEKAIFELENPFVMETYTEMARAKGLSDERYMEQMECCGKWYKNMGLDVRSIACDLKAAELGSESAMLNMGHLNFFDNPGMEGIKEAEKWYQRAADQGNTEAADYLSQIQEAKEFIKRFSGNAELMADYGEMMKTDPGEGKYKIEAFLLLCEAAKLGNRQARYCLAEMYEEGSGVDQNLKRAFALYKELAENGDELSQYALGKMYEEGRGVAKDMRSAVYYYRKAAADDFGAPQLALADIYYVGAGNVAKDLKEAAYWYEKAADNEMRRAQKRISEMYQKGIGVKKDKKKAEYWKKRDENWKGY